MIDIADSCRARIAEEREAAQAAAGGYLLPKADSGRWTYDRETLTVSAGHWGIASGKGSPDVWVPLNDVDGTHIALQDPRATLTRTDALDAMVADIQSERHYVDDNDCWYTCPAATEERDGGRSCNDTKGDTCDCNREGRIERRLRFLGAIWAWHEDYDAERWKP